MAKEPIHVRVQQLCIAAQAGDVAALNTLIEDMAGFFTARFARFVPEEDELRQVARIVVWKAIKQYEDRGKTFMSFMNYHAYKNVLRQLQIAQHGVSRLQRTRDSILASGVSEDSGFDLEEAAAFAEAVGRAPEAGLTDRQVLCLRSTLGGLLQCEIAEAIGVSHTTVQNELNAAVGKLRRHLRVREPINQAKGASYHRRKGSV